MIKKVTELTGLDPVFVKRSGGRIETQAYLREVYRAEGKLGSRYDSNVTAWDPFPYAPQQETGDPILNGIIAPTTTAMVNFVTQTVGWKIDARYNALSYEVNRLWHEDDDAEPGLGVAAARIGRQRPGPARADRPWLGRPVLPVHGVAADRRPDAGDGRRHPRAGEGIPRRPHVLRPRGQPGRAHR